MKIAGMSLKLPTSWKLEKCGDIIDVRDGTHDTPKYQNSGYPLITSKNLKKGGIDFSNVSFISKSDYLEINKRSAVEKNDILFAMIGTIGNPVIVKTEAEFSIKNVALFKLSKSPVDANYFRYLLESRIIKGQLESKQRGVTQKFVSLTVLRNMIVPLPPLNEQKRIVTKIEALQERSGRVKQELEAIRPLLEQFRRSVLAAAFRGDLTKDWREKHQDIEPAEVLQSKFSLVSEHLVNWRTATVGDVVESLKYGTSKKCAYDLDGVPVLRIPNVVNGSIDCSDLKYAELTEQEFKKVSLKPGDILMIRSNGSVSLVGKTAIVSDTEKNLAYAGYLIRIRANQKLVFPHYLNHWFSSYQVRLQIEIPLRSTSGVNNINSSEVKSLSIPIAPLEEQTEIVRRIESLFKIADTIEQQYQEAENQIETLNQSILAKAFRGELVPQDPNDEPASVLLEKIRKEREANPKNTGKTKSKKATKKPPSIPPPKSSKNSKKKPEIDPIQLKIPGID